MEKGSEADTEDLPSPGTVDTSCRNLANTALVLLFHASKGAQPLAHETIAAGKKILVLTPQLPYPPQQGTAIRNYNLIRQLARRHEIHLMSFAVEQQQPPELGPLRDLCATLNTAPIPQRSNWHRLFTTVASPLPDMHHRLASGEFHQILQDASRELRPDVVQIEGIEMAQYGLQAQTLAGEHAPLLVFDAHNAEHLLQKRVFEMDSRRPARWLGALYSFVQWQKLLRYEAAICRQADRVLACSAADARALAHLVPGLEPLLVPNGVDTEQYRAEIVNPAPLGQGALVFTGKMDFRPNVDAVLWFCSEVLPAIRKAAPEAHFYIVGKNPHARLAPLGQRPGVTLTGFVEDIRPYIAAATVYVVPLLTGGGTRLKILEAMAMSKAVISTTVGCEGIHATAEREIVLADSAASFAQQVVALLQDKARRADLGRAARAFVEKHFDWRTVTAPLERAYDR
jgi:sugar transferase (PEP-CTERM/EpsH1 system associated)